MKSIIYFFTGLFVSVFVIVLLYALIFGFPTITWPTIVRCICAFLLSIPIHEFIHGLTCAYVSDNNFKTISYGLNLRGFHAYCKSTLPVAPKMRQYVIIMPCIILAVIPSLVGILVENIHLCILGAFGFAGASKDIHNLIKLRKTMK